MCHNLRKEVWNTVYEMIYYFFFLIYVNMLSLIQTHCRQRSRTLTSYLEDFPSKSNALSTTTALRMR